MQRRQTVPEQAKSKRYFMTIPYQGFLHLNSLRIIDLSLRFSISKRLSTLSLIWFIMLKVALSLFSLPCLDGYLDLKRVPIILND